ncbi:MAG: methyltransferase domain-containing protein [Candidatus Nanohaloarchaeota archaeon QJJ-7]|nr:methyltransferase domain-containing protein [Candidatus Nanohaloarchaeota archaeon QJJ-7]
MSDNMRERVKEGYEEADFSSSQPDETTIEDDAEEMFDAFLKKLPEEGHVADMGCGTGRPYDRILVDEGYDVTGVDIAEVNIQAAREHVSEARFIQSDFTDFEPERSFDGLLCLFALFHIPREEHLETLEKFRGMIVDDAPALLTLGTEDVELFVDEFDGAEMEWSFYDAETNREILKEAGFEILETDMIPDDRGDGEHLWVLARAR